MQIYNSSFHALHFLDSRRRWFGKWIWIRSKWTSANRKHPVIKKTKLKPKLEPEERFSIKELCISEEVGDKWKWKQENSKNLNNSRESFVHIQVLVRRVKQREKGSGREQFTSVHFPFVSLFPLNFFFPQLPMSEYHVLYHTQEQQHRLWCTQKMLLNNVLVSEKSELIFGQKFGTFECMSAPIVIKH